MQMIGHQINETHTSPVLALGTEFQYGGNTYRYVKAAGTIAAGDAVTVATGDTDRPNAVEATSAVSQPVTGVAHVAIASGSYGWITVRGQVTNVKVAPGTAAGAQLGSSATSGTLSTITVSATPTQSEIQRAVAAATGLGVQAMTAESSGTATVFVHG